jgi:hypothetical protein
MTEQTTSKPKADRKRGVGFPQMTVKDAVDAIVVAGQNGPSHSVDAFAAYMGHQTTNSGAFKYKLAALRDYGLISRGDRERVTLTELAEKLVLAAPEHYLARPLLLAAFENCRLFERVYSDNAKNMPLEITRVRNNVVMRHGIAADQADRFVDVFIKSAVFVGIADSDGKTVSLLPRGAAATGQLRIDDEIPGEADENGDTSAPDKTGTGWWMQTPYSVYANTPVPIALRQAWAVDGGEIEFVIRTPKALPPEIYPLVAEMAVNAKRMADLMQPPHDFAYSELKRQLAGQAGHVAGAFASDPVGNELDH